MNKKLNYEYSVSSSKRIIGLLLALISLTSTKVLAADENNVHFHGALVAEPCVISTGDEEVSLDFGSIVDRYLYLNTRTQGQTFEIHLEECDLSSGNSVKVYFTGLENSSLPGLLAIDSSSEATGIAIGFETLSAKPLLLNQVSNKFTLKKGNNVIAMKTYVKGEPTALKNRTIERGPFNAVATFNLEYE